MKLKTKIGIYKITNSLNECYIGQTVNWEKRKRQYKNLHCKKQPKIYASLLKYGWNKHKFEIIEECCKSQLDQKESFYKRKFIKKFGWKKALFCKIKDRKGGQVSEETKLKISKTKLKFYKNNPGNTKGMKFIKSQETCNKISKSLLGKEKSIEHKQNMSLCRLGKTTKKCRPILQYDLQGNFIKEWNKIKDASISLGASDGNIICCAKGIQKTAYGFIWKFKKCLKYD